MSNRENGTDDNDTDKNAATKDNIDNISNEHTVGIDASQSETTTSKFVSIHSRTILIHEFKLHDSYLHWYW